MRCPLVQDILNCELRVSGEQSELTPSSVIVWLRKLFPDHKHTYDQHELHNMASVRLKSHSLRLTPDANALSFEVSQAITLSTLLSRLPAGWLTSPKQRYQSLWQAAADEKALARRTASAETFVGSSAASAAAASAAAASAAPASAAPASAPVASPAAAPIDQLGMSLASASGRFERAAVPAEDEGAAIPAAAAPIDQLGMSLASASGWLERAAVPAEAEGAAEEDDSVPHMVPEAEDDVVDGAAAATAISSSSRSKGGQPQSSNTALEPPYLFTPEPQHARASGSTSTATGASVTPIAVQVQENLTTLNKAEANNQLRSLTIKYRSLQEKHAALRQQQDSFKLLQSRAYFDEARNAIVFRVVAGTQHTFKLELTRRLPSLDEPPVDEIKLTKVSTQPAPYGAKAANPIEYGLYDEDAADSLKSRERSTRAIRPPRPLDARYYGFSDVGQAFCMKLYYMPHPAARTLREAMLLHSDKARALLACWAKGGKTTSKETFTMMVPAVFGLFAFEEGDVHALFDELKSDKDELPHDELKDRLAAGGRDWALALGPAVDPIPKADLDFNFQEGYAQVSVLVRLTEPWHPPPSRHAQNIPSPGGAASGSERGASQSQ